MRAVEFLCFGGTEIANSARTTHYTRELGGVPGLTLGADCPCAAIDEGYDFPSTDPAPWYEPTRSDSVDFYGFYAHSISVVSSLVRNVGASGQYGSYLSPARYNGRQLQVEGTMIASSMQGMAYGERWLAEVLRGSPCNHLDCPTDDAIILPACPDQEYEYDGAFRHLVDVGCVDGPTFASINDLPECYIQTATFALTSSQPYLFHPTTRCLDAEYIPDSYLDSPIGCALTTPQWMGEGTYIIDITAETDVTNIVIKGRLSIDGDCPVTGDGTSVMPSFTYTIPTMSMDDRLVIDGMRRHAYYYDASVKRAKSALPYIAFDGPWLWPDVGTCSTMCLTLELESGDAVATVDTTLREL